MSSPVNFDTDPEACDLVKSLEVNNELFSNLKNLTTTIHEVAPPFVFDKDDKEPEKENEEDGDIDPELVQRHLKEWNLIHVFSIKTQGNLYTLNADLPRTKGKQSRKTILCASLKKPVYAFGFDPMLTVGLVRPCREEIKFSYLPAGTEVISIDAFARPTMAGPRFVVGVTLAKHQGVQENGVFPNSRHFFNIYSDWNNPMNLHSLAENCISLDLDFIPYQLTHCEVPLPTSPQLTETIFLLTGSDNRVHVYFERPAEFTYVEVETDVLFPELDQTFPSVPTQVKVLYFQSEKRRFTAVGCECGNVYLSLVRCDGKNKEEATWINGDGQGIVASLSFFPSHFELSKWNDHTHTISPYCSDVNRPVTLLCVHSFSGVVLFRNIRHQYLSVQEKLPRSNRYDTPTCAVMLSEEEIFVGTFGLSLLQYRHLNGSWQLVTVRTLSHPIHNLLAADLTGDGVEEVAVMTGRGVKVLQRHVDSLKHKRQERLSQFLKSLSDKQ